jgi:hypothetical protein
MDVSIPTLMLSLVHMSGDPGPIRGDLKPAGLFLNEVQGYMSEEGKAAVRKIAPPTTSVGNAAAAQPDIPGGANGLRFFG